MNVLYYGKVRIKKSRQVVTAQICKMSDGRIQVKIANDWHPMHSVERITQ